MDSKHFEAMLADYLGDELSPDDRRAFEEHLAGSPADRAELESLQAVLRSLRQLPPPPALYAEGHEPSGQHRGPRRLWMVRHIYRPLAYAAVLLIGVGIGWSARPAPAVVPADTEQPRARTFHIRTPAVPTDKTPSRFVRNALALSSAFTQPPTGKPARANREE